MATDYNIIAVKGDTIRWNPIIYDVSGSTYDFRGCTLYMQVRNGYYPATLVASYTHYVTSNAIGTGPNGYTGGISANTGGTLYLCLGSSYSQNLSVDRTCKYDVKILTQSLSDYKTLIKGNIQVLPEVTDT